MNSESNGTEAESLWEAADAGALSRYGNLTSRSSERIAYRHGYTEAYAAQQAEIDRLSTALTTEQVRDAYERGARAAQRYSFKRVGFCPNMALGKEALAAWEAAWPHRPESEFIDAELAPLLAAQQAEIARLSTLTDLQRARNATLCSIRSDLESDLAKDRATLDAMWNNND